MRRAWEDKWSASEEWSARECRRKTQCKRRCRQRSHAGSKGRIQTGRDRINARRGFTRVTKLIINLDKLNIGELFEARHERARNVVQRAIRLASPCKINVHHIIYKLNFAIACKTITDHGKTLVPFHVTGTHKELIEDRINNIL